MSLLSPPSSPPPPAHVRHCRTTPPTSTSRDRRRQPRRQRVRLDAENLEALELALTSAPLHSDRDRYPSSLHRQEAFCDTSTRRMTKPGFGGAGLWWDRHDDEEAAAHEMALYNRTARPQKRPRRQEMRLDLAMSFGQLGHDEQIARYLASPDASDEEEVEKMEHHQEDENEGGREEENQARKKEEENENEGRRAADPPRSQLTSRTRVATSSPLHIIYELSDEAPGLVEDTSSFSSSNIDEDMELQDAAAEGWAMVGKDGEVHSPTIAGGAWVVVLDEHDL